ncbi:MAG TPA: TraR/DksA family transcriptional regulator [Candidatus Omnitrophota bacterium]|nr:TraR/DksA family transcriptional regulator [Candidatus Omnitrophota bacterium]HPS20010.1 TraR/DksA family transcriptional regulator [Candidatus Omnitrophota bacterium]
MVKKKMQQKGTVGKDKTGAKSAKPTPKNFRIKIKSVPKVKLSKEMLKVRESLIREKEGLLEEFLKMKGESLGTSSKDASGDLSGYSFHMADMASDLYDRELSLEITETERERLYALDDAIKRIDEGSYGKCDMCGGEIPKLRLKAMPQAQYCIKCQQKRENIGE